MAELDCLNSENELDSSLNSAIEVQSQLNSDSLSSELGENNEISSVLAIDDINSEMDYEESTDSNIGEEGQMDSHLDLPSSSGGKQYTGKDTDNIIVTVDNNNNVIYATLKQIKFNSVSEFPEVGSEHLIYIDHSNKELYAWDSDLSSYYKLIETPDNPETPDIPTKLSEFENDVGFITKDDLPETPKIPEKLSEFINDGDGNSPFATEDFVLQNAGSGGGGGPTVPVVDNLTSLSTTSALSANQGRVLNEKITEVENKIPTNTSDLNNDAGFVSKTVSDLENYTTTDKMNKVLENKANKDQIPDVSNFITKAVSDLENYYTKLQSYTKDEVNSLVSAIPKFSIEVVNSLPVFDISTTTIYLLRTEGSTVGNLFVEFIYVNDSWESLGAQTLDLTGYVTTEALNSAISELDAKKQDTLIAGKNILISNNVISADFPDDEKIVLLESPVRIWNLNSGIYLVPKGATIYYNGATSESSMSYRNDTPSVLIVKYHLNEEGTADLENKRYMLFSYSNEAQSYLGFIQGSTTEVAGSYSTDYCFTRTYKDAVDGIRQNGYVDTKTAQTIKGVKTFEDDITGTISNAKADADGNIITDTYARKDTTELSNLTTAKDGTLMGTKHIPICSTAGGTSAKVVTINNFTLYSGAEIFVYFENANTYAGLITLNVNGTGAKNIYINNTVTSASNYTIQAGWHRFYYNGTNYYTGTWTKQNVEWANGSNYCRRLQHYNYITAGSSAITAGNIIVADANGLYKHLKAGTAFDITKPILYASSAISANARGNNNYIYIDFTVTTTQSITLTANKPVYIKGKLDGKLFTPVSTTPLTQTEPTSPDGYHYMLLGIAYATTTTTSTITTTNVRLLSEHPMFVAREDGSFGTQSQLLDAHPVNSIYMSTDPTSPAKLFGGSWTAIPEGYALWTTQTDGQGGQTISAGLPNIKGQIDIRCVRDGTLFANNSGALDYTTGGSSTSWSNGISIASTSKNLDRLYFNANTSNSIYNDSTTTVQPPAYKIYAWERIS